MIGKDFVRTRTVSWSHDVCFHLCSACTCNEWPAVQRYYLNLKMQSVVLLFVLTLLTTKCCLVLLQGIGDCVDVLCKNTKTDFGLFHEFHSKALLSMTMLAWVVIFALLYLFVVCDGFVSRFSSAPVRFRHRLSMTTIAPIAPAVEPVQRFKGLKPIMYAHPYDTDVRGRRPRRFSLSNFLYKTWFSLIGRGQHLGHLASCILVGPDQMGPLHTMLTNAAARLDMDPPDLFITHSRLPFACSKSYLGHAKPFIVMSSTVVGLLEPVELMAVLGQELGRICCQHGLWTIACGEIAYSCNRLLPLGQGLLKWNADELTCDRAALVVTGNVQSVVSAMVKMSGTSTNHLCNELQLTAFLDQAARLEEHAAKKRITWGCWFKEEIDPPSPMAAQRAVEIMKWANSQEYAELVAGALTSADVVK